jgi:hypothetical protein
MCLAFASRSSITIAYTKAILKGLNIVTVRLTANHLLDFQLMNSASRYGGDGMTTNKLAIRSTMIFQQPDKYSPSVDC